MKKYLITLTGMFIAMFAVLLLMGLSHAQDVQTSVTVEQGSLYQEVRFTGVEAIDDNAYTESKYRSELSAPSVDKIEFHYNFSGQANTSITGVSSFGVPSISYKETVGGTYVNKSSKDCVSVAAGSKFTVSGIQNYESVASPSGDGMCLGVNYEAKAELGIGRIAFGQAEIRIGETITEDEDGNTTSTFGYANQLVKTRVNGFFSNFYGQTIAESCPPAGEVPGNPLLGDILTLCAEKPGGLAPWEITP